MDANSHMDINTFNDVSIDEDINMHNANKPINSDPHPKTSPMTRKTTMVADRDETFCVSCSKTKLKNNTQTDVHTKTQAQANMSTHTTTHTVSHNDPTHINTRHSRFNKNSNSNNNMHYRTHTHGHYDTSSLTDTSANTHTTGVHTPNNTQHLGNNNTHNHTPPTTGTSTPTVVPAGLYNGTNLNNKYTHADTHAYFLYYLYQYFNLVSSVLFYLSAAVNPLLYNLMSARYRHAVHSLIHTHSHTPAHRLHTLTTQHSTTTL